MSSKEDAKINVKYNDREGSSYGDPEKRAEKSTVHCECGENRLLVNFILGPFCGCYLKVTCAACGSEKVIFDDFA